MQLNTRLLIVANCAALAFSSAFAESIKTIKTERGADVEVIEDMPVGPGPFPAVILAPGGQYHARLPILEQLSKSLTTNGFAVFRFNWAYYSKDGKNEIKRFHRHMENASFCSRSEGRPFANSRLQPRLEG